MATRKTSTRAKSKTTKTKAASTRKPRTVKKAVTKKATTKKTVAAAVKQEVVIQRGPSLRMLHLMGAVLFIALAVLATFIMQPISFSLSLTHLTSDPLLSQGGSTVFASASRSVYDVEIRWILVTLLAFSSVLPILYLTKLKDFYARAINRRVIGLRWFDLAVSSALMVETIMLLIGYNDLMTLKLAGALLGATCLLGWLAEKQNADSSQPIWSAYNISVFTGVMPWVLIGLTKLATIVWGGVRSPWYVYAACISALIGFSLLAINQRNSHRRFRNWASYEIVERNYVLINFVNKLAFAAILIIGLQK